MRFLNTIVPARHLDYFHQMALIARGGQPAASEDVQRVMRRYDLRPVG